MARSGMPLDVAAGLAELLLLPVSKMVRERRADENTSVFRETLTIEMWTLMSRGWQYLLFHKAPRFCTFASLMYHYGTERVKQEIQLLMLKHPTDPDSSPLTWMDAASYLSEALLDYHTSRATFQEVMTHQMQREPTPEQWLQSGCRYMDRQVYEPPVTLTAAQVVEEVRNHLEFSSSGTLEELPEDLEALSRAKNLPSKLLKLGEEKFTSEKVQMELNRCREFWTTPIANWTERNVKQWSRTLQHMRDASPRNLSLEERVEVRAEIAVVVMRAAELFNRLQSPDWAMRATQEVAVALCFVIRTYKTSKLFQIPTGEGKSLTTAVIAACFTLLGRTVDVVTSSKILSTRDEASFRDFFRILGLTSSCCCTELSKVNVYTSDVVYGDELAFSGDYLQEQFFRRFTRGKRKFDICLVDEVDNLLFDRSNEAVQLEGKSPGESSLFLLLASMWKSLESYYHHIVEDPIQSGKFYYVPANYTRKSNGCIRTLDCLETYEECRIPITELRQSLTELAESYGNAALTPFSAEALERKRRFEKLEEELAKVLEELDSLWAREEKDEQTMAQMSLAVQRRNTLLQELDDARRLRAADPIELPAHQLLVVRDKVSTWARNAVRALLDLTEGREYVLDGEVVKIVDFRVTGVVHDHMKWSDGLHQFLELKHGLPMTTISPMQCFLSTIGFFCKYKTMYGMTGTLGSNATKRFLKEQYQVDLLELPPFKRSMRRPDPEPWSRSTAASAPPLAVKELAPFISSNCEEVFDAILRTCSRMVLSGRPVLLLVPHIEEVRKFDAVFRQQYPPLRVHAFTGTTPFDHQTLDCGEIVVATNIAGRGVDFTPTSAAEDNGGLHVCITFFSPSLRVAMQIAGRTARQGRRGTIQLMLVRHDAGNRHLMTKLMAERDAQEDSKIAIVRRTVSAMKARDTLLLKFGDLVNQVLGHGNNSEGVNFLSAVLEARDFWETFRDDRLRFYQSELQMWHRQHRWNRPATPLSESSSDEDLERHMQEAIGEREPDAIPAEVEAEFRQIFTRKSEDLFRESTPGQRYPTDVLDEVFSPTERSTQSAVDVDDAKEEELEALKELWGQWLEGRQQSFEAFADDVHRRAASGDIISNPHYYVLKGNRLLGIKKFSAAVEAYDKAISMDANAAYVAHFYKAIALIGDGCSATSGAIDELEKAKQLVQTTELPRLGKLLAVTTGPKREGIVNWIFNQIQFLHIVISLADSHIQTLRENDTKKFHVDYDSRCTIEELLKKENMSFNCDDVAGMFASDGLSFFYPLKKSLAVGMFLALSSAAVLCGVLTGGVGLYCSFFLSSSIACGTAGVGVYLAYRAYRCTQGDDSWEWGKEMIKIGMAFLGGVTLYHIQYYASKIVSLTPTAIDITLRLASMSAGILGLDKLSEIRQEAVKLLDYCKEKADSFVSSSEKLKLCIQADTTFQVIKYEMLARGDAYKAADTEFAATLPVASNASAFAEVLRDVRIAVTKWMAPRGLVDRFFGRYEIQLQGTVRVAANALEDYRQSAAERGSTPAAEPEAPLRGADVLEGRSQRAHLPSDSPGFHSLVENATTLPTIRVEEEITSSMMSFLANLVCTRIEKGIQREVMPRVYSELRSHVFRAANTQPEESEDTLGASLPPRTHGTTSLFRRVAAAGWAELLGLHHSGSSPHPTAALLRRGDVQLLLVLYLVCAALQWSLSLLWLCAVFAPVTVSAVYGMA